MINKKWSSQEQEIILIYLAYQVKRTCNIISWLRDNTILSNTLKLLARIIIKHVFGGSAYRVETVSLLNRLFRAMGMKKR